jgi:hypothetical protein
VIKSPAGIDFTEKHLIALIHFSRDFAARSPEGIHCFPIASQPLGSRRTKRARLALRIESGQISQIIPQVGKFFNKSEVGRRKPGPGLYPHHA